MTLRNPEGLHNVTECVCDRPWEALFLRTCILETDNHYGNDDVKHLARGALVVQTGHGGGILTSSLRRSESAIVMTCCWFGSTTLYANLVQDTEMHLGLG